jgi:hypothetical protein
MVSDALFWTPLAIGPTSNEFPEGAFWMASCRVYLFKGILLLPLLLLLSTLERLLPFEYTLVSNKSPV